MGVVLKWTGSRTGWGETELAVRLCRSRVPSGGEPVAGPVQPGMQDGPMISALQAIIDM
jgi:hypothetical protein